MICEQCQGRYHPIGRHPECQCDCNVEDHERFIDTPEGFISVPKPFEGLTPERRANIRTHSFGPPEGRCWDCDVRMGSESANYPCGAGVPRVLVRRGSNEETLAVGNLVAAAQLGEKLYQKGEAI